MLPLEYNPRTIDEDADAELGEGLEKFGIVEDPVVNTRAGREGRIVGGFQRWRKAKDAGQTELRCVEVDLSPEDERELNIRLNANGGRFDQALLVEHFSAKELAEWGFPADALADFERAAAKLGDSGGSGKPRGGAAGGNDAALEHAKRCQERLQVKFGQVYRFGDNLTLACEESKDRPRVQALFQLAGFDPAEVLMATDPPYCSGGFQEANRSAGTWGTIASDGLSSEGYRGLITAVMVAARPHTAYVFTDWRMWCSLYGCVESAGLGVRAMIIWDKGHPGLGGMWRPQMEIILFGSRAGAKREKGKAAVGNVCTFPRTGNRLHYTEKPVELMAHLIANDASGGRGAFPVYDPFMGSGTTLVACHRLGRPAVGIDVEPLCCAVAIDRLATETGIEPELVAEVPPVEA